MKEIDLLYMYGKMVEIRRFEEKVIELYLLGIIQGLVHSCNGQEAVAVGVCSALEKDDYILSNHRGHGHSIAKGVPPKYLMAELLGKETGVCKGIGGSMHSTYLENGILFSTAIVGGNIPIATGVGLGIELNKENRVVVCFFGDGASNTGAFHESINLASIWKLPVIFVCENNLYAISMPYKESAHIDQIANRAGSYGIIGDVVDGMDVQAVFKSTAKAVERAKSGLGPTLIECKTYRYKGHGLYDPGTGYRPKDEIERWLQKCPITCLKQRLLEKEVTDELEIEVIEKKAEKQIEEAVVFAKESNYPSEELLKRMVYSKKV